MFEPKLKERREGNFRLDVDVRKGFNTAVRNSQARLAFEYAAELIDGLIDYTETLEARIDALESDRASAKAAPAKKAAAKADSADDE